MVPHLRVYSINVLLGRPGRLPLPPICIVLLDPRDPLLQSERMQGFAADPVYVKGEVFAYAGRPQNLKDLKAQNDKDRASSFQGTRELSRKFASQYLC